jgi:SDR family mycofactocin-dependent oxidoreductase
MSGLCEKVVVITGAGRGMGRAHCERFADEGADVIAIDVPAAADELHYTATEVEKRGRRCVAGLADVVGFEALAAAVDSGVGDLGGPDVIVANAGTYTAGAPTWELTEEVWRRTLDVDLTGVWCTCRATAPHLIDRGAGSMILTSSIAGLRGLVGVAHYTAAKHGVVGLMCGLAKELAPQSIRVNTVHPTNVDTPMIQNDHERGAFRPDLRHVTREQFAEAACSMNMLAIPWVEPVDVANASLFLASDEARYITSVTLPVDAGSTQR